MLDDPEQDYQLGPAFDEVGFVKEEVDIFLAHIGPLPPVVRLEGLVIEESTRANVGEIAETKMRAFSSSDDQPPAEELKRQTKRHLTELEGIGRGMLARLFSDPAGMICWYDDPVDIWINLLGIRKIYRGLGIGRALLHRLLIDSFERGCRSVLINVMEENTGAIQLYKRLGFSDQVYWRQHYLSPWQSLPDD